MTHMPPVNWPAQQATGEPATPQYVNTAALSFGQWDVVIDFRLQYRAAVDTPENEGPTVEPVIQVVMSPTHAKVLAYLLDQTITEWENRFGELPSVEQLIPTPPQAERPEGQPGEQHA